MAIPNASGGHEPELIAPQAQSPSEAEQLVTAGAPLEALGLHVPEEAILRVALDPNLPRAREAAALLAELRNFNIRANVPLWLRIEAIMTIVAHSRRVPVTRVHGLPVGEQPVITSTKFEVVAIENGVAITKLVERGGIVIPLVSRGQKRVSLEIPEYVHPNGTILTQEILPWDFEWELYFLTYLPYAMREVFREDDFRPPSMWMQSGSPGGLLSLDYPTEDADGNEGAPFGDLQPDRCRGTAAEALLSVFLSELSVRDRFIYRASTEGNSTPRDLGRWLAEPADTLRKQRDQLYEIAKASLASDILNSEIFGPWQPDPRPGPYNERTHELFERFQAQCREWRDWSPPRGELYGIAQAYGRDVAVDLVGKWANREITANSALRRYGEGKSLDELRPTSQDVYSSELGLIAEGCDRLWAPRRGISKGQLYQSARESWDKPHAGSEAPAPSRDWKPRCLKPGCAHRVVALYQSRSVPPTNTETRPSRVSKPKEKTDAHRYCKRHLREREETMSVTQAEIADRLRGLEDLHAELREAMGQILTALTWRFPNDDELLDAVDSFRRDALGQQGVKVLAD